jgi:iron complex transport system substrate-binding protein
MKYIFIIIIFILICFAGVIAFNHTKKTVPLIDKTKIPRQSANRIVSLSPNITEILFALGLDEKVIAVSSDSDYPSEAAKKEKIGTFWQPNTETIIACKPDLVISEQFEQQKAVGETLKRLGYQVLSLRIETIDELFTAIKEIGIAANSAAASGKLISSINSRLDIIEKKLAASEKIKVLWVVQPEPLRLAGQKTFVNELIERAGGRNAIGPTIQQYPGVGSEEILASDAEVIIQSAMGNADTDEQQKSAENFWSRYPNLPAVKNKRIYVINPDTVLRLGPRLPEGIELIAKCLHPEIFADDKNTND